MARKSRPLTTSTTNRAKWRGGSHSSTDGGIKKPVSRSIRRKLLMRRISGDGGANRAARFYRSMQFRVKYDRLLATASSQPAPASLGRESCRTVEEDADAATPQHGHR